MVVDGSSNGTHMRTPAPSWTLSTLREAETWRVPLTEIAGACAFSSNRSARLIEGLEAGIVSAMNSNGGREVLVPARD